MKAFSTRVKRSFLKNRYKRLSFFLDIPRFPIERRERKLGSKEARKQGSKEGGELR